MKKSLRKFLAVLLAAAMLAQSAGVPPVQSKHDHKVV
jgi:hypothetical protein